MDLKFKKGWKRILYYQILSYIEVESILSIDKTHVKVLGKTLVASDEP